MIIGTETVDLTLHSRDNLISRAERFKDFSLNETRDTELLNLEETRDGLEKVAKEFEGVFIHMLLKEMRSTVNDEDSIMPQSAETKMYQEMLDEELAKKLSSKQNLGIASSIIRAYEDNLPEKKTDNKNSL